MSKNGALQRLAGQPMAALQFPDEDRFGLPTRFSLLDREEKTLGRKLAVENLAKEVFATAVDHLGKEDATKLFKKIIVGRRAKPRGSTSLERDHYLLMQYDVQVNMGQDPKIVPRLVAERAPKKYGASPNAIAKQVRRLVKARERMQADYEADMKVWCEAYKTRYGEYPTSLLAEWDAANVDK